MADSTSAATGIFGVRVEEVSALAPMVTLGAHVGTDPVYNEADRSITRADVEAWIQAVSARVDLRLANRSRITDAPRTRLLTAAAHDAVVNGAASYMVAAATPTRASLNDPGAYDAVLWSRYESALDEAAATLDGWIDELGGNDPSATVGHMSGNFPPPMFLDAFRF